MQRITGVDPSSIAEELGIQAGDRLVSINGQPVLDVVDYQYFSAEEVLLLGLLDEAGQPYEAQIKKDSYEPLGLSFESGLMSSVRSCKNHCLFCFIDQMPKPSRDTLQFKDDDWRMSFIMGNYITLTNVDDEEFARIIARRVSPLYISVHATDPDIRVAMMRNPTAGRLMERLNALREAGLRFHCQIVCCPGINNGEVLQHTLEDLAALYPAAQSVAVVPVGLTKFRDHLAPLRVFTRQEAKDTLKVITAFSQAQKVRFGTAFVFPADELVLEAGEELPSYEAYEDFSQIENGVGLLRLFEEEFLAALEEEEPLGALFTCDAAGGVAAHSFFQGLFQKLIRYNIQCTPFAVKNNFFGESVTVGGLVTAQDIIAQLKGRLTSDTLLLPHNMLREQEDVFLDGMSVETLSRELGVRVLPVRGDGENWIHTLFALGRR